MLVPSQEAVHDEITGARYEHTSKRVYIRGRGEGRRFAKNDNVIVPCLLVIGPSMPPPSRSRMNFQGNRLGRGLVVCTLNRPGVHVHFPTRCCFGYVAARTNTGKLWACVGQLARARIIDLVNGNGVTCIGFLMRPGWKGVIEKFLTLLRDSARGHDTLEGWWKLKSSLSLASSKFEKRTFDREEIFLKENEINDSKIFLYFPLRFHTFLPLSKFVLL